MLSDRFGAFEAIANSTVKLARHVSEDELSMDLLVAEAILEFADDLRRQVAWPRVESWRVPAGSLRQSSTNYSTSHDAAVWDFARLKKSLAAANLGILFAELIQYAQFKSSRPQLRNESHADRGN